MSRTRAALHALGVVATILGIVLGLGFLTRLAPAWALGFAVLCVLGIIFVQAYESFRNDK